MKHKVLVLGSRGYIGRNLLKFLETRSEVHFHKRGESTIVDTLTRINPTIIVNSSASGLRDSFEESLNANVLYQLDFLKHVTAMDMKVTWIQLSSYYELQIPLGRDDFYSRNKYFLRQFLYDLNDKGLIHLKNVFLPHVFGLDEKAWRLIPSIKRVKQDQTKVDFSNGKQFIPILHIDDACSAIWEAINSKPMDISAAPIWYGRVRELVELLLEPSLQKLVKFDSGRVEVDDSFPMVKFPESVPGWNASYSTDNLINDFSN